MRAHGNVSSACPAYRALLTSGGLRLSPAIRVNRGVSETVVGFKESSAAAPTRVATPSFERPPPLYSRATRLGTAAHGVTLTRADRLPLECCWCRNARPGALLPPCVCVTTSALLLLPLPDTGGCTWLTYSWHLWPSVIYGSPRLPGCCRGLIGKLAQGSWLSHDGGEHHGGPGVRAPSGGGAAGPPATSRRGGAAQEARPTAQGCRDIGS